MRFRRRQEHELMDEPIKINGKPTTLRELETNAQLAVEEANTTWELGMGYSILYLIERLKESHGEG